MSIRNQFIGLTGQPFKEDQIVYGAKDVEYLIGVREHQLPLIDRNKLNNVVDLENEVVKAFADIEYNGLDLDTEKWKEIEAINIDNSNTLEEELDEIVQLNMKRDRGGFELNQALSGRFNSFLLSGAFTDYSHKELEDGEANTQFENDSFSLRAELNHSLIADQSGLFGFSYYDESFAIQGVEKYLPTAETNKTAIFVLQNYENDQITYRV